MGKFGDSAKKAASWAVEEWKRDQERERERKAERDRQVAERQRAKADKAKKRAAILRRTCTYAGGTSDVPMLVRGKKYGFQLDDEGISVLGQWDDAPHLVIPWGDVINVEVADASRTEIKSRVSHHDAGGLATPLFTTAPVAKVRSEFVGQSYLTIETQSGRHMLLVPVPGEDLKGRLLLTESKRKGKPSEPDGARLQESDPLDQLTKLGELRAAGVLTDDEFEQKKQEILARI